MPKSLPLIALMEFLLSTKQYIALAAVIYNNVLLINRSVDIIEIHLQASCLQILLER